MMRSPREAEAMPKLTPRQAEAMKFIRSFIAERGYSPTWIEINVHLGNTSPNATRNILQALAAKGVIEIVPTVGRGIRLAGEDTGTRTLPESVGDDLTPRQRDIFLWIASRCREAGSPPSRREIAARFEMSVNGALGHVEALIRKGYLGREPRLARTLTPLVTIPEEQPS